MAKKQGGTNRNTKSKKILKSKPQPKVYLSISGV